MRGNEILQLTKQMDIKSRCRGRSKITNTRNKGIGAPKERGNDRKKEERGKVGEEAMTLPLWPLPDHMTVIYVLNRCLI